MSIRSYQDLEVWKRGMKVAKSVHEITREFPVDERYGLVSQLRRCAVSVPSNIAEGHARFSTKDYLKHLSYSMGSLAEVETQLLLSRDFGYTSSQRSTEIFGPLLENCDVLGKQLRNLAQALERKLGQE